MRRFLYCFAALFLMLILQWPAASYGQSTVTFRVDMSARIQDSTFVPGRSTPAIFGNQVPFSPIHTVTLQPTTPSANSIYTAKVHFPSFLNDRELQFHYIIKKGGQTLKEENNLRTVTLNGKAKTLPIVGFDEALQ